MKAFVLLAAVFGLVAASALEAADTTKPVRTEVIFDHPEKFTDIKDASQPTQSGQDAILGQIREFLVYEANYFIPDGCKLTMTFTDIDLAGAFEPLRRPGWDDVRIVKSIYPPGFKFTWTVTNASGQVIKQGKADIRDMNFDWQINGNRDDPLHFEKTLLAEWMRNTLGDIKTIASQH